MNSRWKELDKFRRPEATYNVKFWTGVATVICVIVSVTVFVLMTLIEWADEPALDPVYHRIHEALPDIEGPLHSDHDAPYGAGGADDP